MEDRDERASVMNPTLDEPARSALRFGIGG